VFVSRSPSAKRIAAAAVAVSFPYDALWLLQACFLLALWELEGAGGEIR